MNDYVRSKEHKEILLDTCTKNQELSAQCQEQRVSDFSVFRVRVALFLVLADHERHVSDRV
jgi:hypothetical protein